MFSRAETDQSVAAETQHARGGESEAHAMANLTLHAYSDPDGVLRLTVPVDVPGAAYEVQVTPSPAPHTQRQLQRVVRRPR